MAYGDNLITLSQLEHRRRDGDWRILGTGVTRQVSSILRTPLDVIEILPDKAAFNSIKEYGIVAAARDFISVASDLREFSKMGDTLVFERRDVRNTLLTPRGRHMICPVRKDNAYHDRGVMVEKIFGRMRPWPHATIPQGRIRRVAINPCARYSHRRLSSATMDNVIRLCQERDWGLTVIDPCGQYETYAGRVEQYVRGPALPEAVTLLRQSDLYLGPDSFFMHLAYYFAMPHFGFFYLDNLYFMTPGMEEQGNWITFNNAQKYTRLAEAVDRYVGG
jgi:hypothetical protein